LNEVCEVLYQEVFERLLFLLMVWTLFCKENENP
jgi:hypothetical protein